MLDLVVVDAGDAGRDDRGAGGDVCRARHAADFVQRREDIACDVLDAQHRQITAGMKLRQSDLIDAVGQLASHRCVGIAGDGSHIDGN